MRAARFHGNRDIRVEDVPVPAIRDGQVLVEIEWCGICGSDLHEYLVGPGIIPTKDRPHSLTKAVMPVTMGHEFCGRVCKVAPGSKLAVGQPVMVDPRLFCSKCHSCKIANTNICTNFGFLGLQSHDGGGYSEFVAVNEEMCYVLPDASLLKDAALIEPLVVARHAIRTSGIAEYGDKNVLVVGGGPVGLAVIFNLRARGVAKLFVSEPTAKRQQQNASFVDRVLNPLKENVGNECRSITDGEGFDVVFDCAGIPPGLKDGMDALRRGGSYVNVAGWEKECIIPMQDFMLKEIIFRASMSYNEQDFKEIVEEFIAGKYKGFENLVTARISLEDVVQKGFEELITHKDDHVKIMVTPKQALLVH